MAYIETSSQSQKHTHPFSGLLTSYVNTHLNYWFFRKHLCQWSSTSLNKHYQVLHLLWSLAMLTKNSKWILKVTKRSSKNMPFRLPQWLKEDFHLSPATRREKARGILSPKPLIVVKKMGTQKCQADLVNARVIPGRCQCVQGGRQGNAFHHIPKSMMICFEVIL